MFLGRQRELNLLKNLLSRKSAALVICRGRRRIGKSTLIQEFGKSVPRFYEFQGLAPREKLTNQDQLTNFSRQLATQFKLPELGFKSWSEAFSLLARETNRNRVVILLDEISWMGAYDPDFAGVLKIAWDTEFKKNSRLILVFCGSVTSWIDKNILKSQGFVGRVSLTLSLDELPLNCCNEFWRDKKKYISDYEKFKILSVTGGIPRYLEEIKPKLSAEENIKQMCFIKEGLLFSEFDRIFDDIFSQRSKVYKEIIQTLVHGSKTLTEICAELKRPKSGVMSGYLDDLTEAGMLSHDLVCQIGGKKSGLGTYRLKDNYLRFYLKYIEPKKEQILKGLYDTVALENLPQWETMMGYQFENLVLGNMKNILELLSIPREQALSAGPYFQNQTKRNKGCQIDLLIETSHTLYICEVKFKKHISKTVIPEVQEKITKLKIPKYKSVRAILIYCGELAPGIIHDDYFNNVIPLAKLLNEGG